MKYINPNSRSAIANKFADVVMLEIGKNGNPETLIKVTVDDLENAAKMVDDLMGKKPEKRFQFIYDQALTKMDKIINNLDI